MKRWEYDVLVLGLGPAGMAVSIMAAEMGLRVCAVEKHKIGGECMNVGCIPSKALLKTAAARHAALKMPDMALGSLPPPPVGDVFGRIRGHIKFINDNKTSAMFKKVDLLLGEGAARFVDPHTVEVGRRRITAKRIFICTGTRPAVPPVPGIETLDVLTNENMFALDAVPESLVIIGGGAIGCEMAQAFARLGARTSIVHMDDHLLPFGEPEAGELLRQVFEREGIEVYNGRRLTAVARENEKVVVTTDRGERLTGRRLLVAAGRRMPADELNLAAAGVAFQPNGISVDRWLRTSQPHIYAAGDCNGRFLLSHAAMHQGMLALMNCMLPFFLRRDFRKYVVPWTVFTDPQISQVGPTRRDLKAAGRRFEEVGVRYEDYGAAIAEGVGIGYVKACMSPAGRVLSAQVAGEGSGEMINEWGLAVQGKMRITDIMFLQHSFPSMSFLNKRVSETWMMNRMRAPWLRRMARWFF